ncbi:MAG TPA: hypothetical protein VI390_09190, partial [Methyloceanibacter sp.]
FYWFAISTAGTYAVFRYMKDKWQNLIPVDDQRRGEQRAASQKRTACSHGGKPLHLVRERPADRRDIPPKDGQSVGVGMEQFSQEPVTEAFDDFTVTAH